MLKTTGFIIANHAAILATGATVEEAVADFNRHYRGPTVRDEAGNGITENRPLAADDFPGQVYGDFQGLHLRPATAALLAQVEEVGGAISCEVVDGIACTCDEAAPPVRQIATGLSEAGRRVLAEFLAVHLSDKALAHMVAAYESDITFAINDSLAGHLEVSGMHTATGNPAVRVFDGDEVVLEDVEVEE